MVNIALHILTYLLIICIYDCSLYDLQGSLHLYKHQTAGETIIVRLHLWHTDIQLLNVIYIDGGDGVSLININLAWH